MSEAERAKSAAKNLLDDLLQLADQVLAFLDDLALPVLLLMASQKNYEQHVSSDVYCSSKIALDRTERP